MRIPSTLRYDEFAFAFSRRRFADYRGDAYFWREHVYIISSPPTSIRAMLRGIGPRRRLRPAKARKLHLDKSAPAAVEQARIMPPLRDYARAIAAERPDDDTLRLPTLRFVAEFSRMGRLRLMPLYARLLL